MDFGPRWYFINFPLFMSNLFFNICLQRVYMVSPIITDQKTNDYTNPEGQIYLTVGTGGTGLHKLNGNKAPYITIAQDEEFGFLNIDVTANDVETTFVGTFYANDAGEKIIDQFTITKSASEDSSYLPPPPPPGEEIEEGDEEEADEGITGLTGQEETGDEEEEDVEEVAEEEESESKSELEESSSDEDDSSSEDESSTADEEE
jgi:hypothetical protein